MHARRLAPLLVGLLALAVLVVLVTGHRGDDRYRFRMELGNALGLRDGSLVTVGGVEVGKVKVTLEHGKGDRVLVEGRLDDGKGPIGRDARAYITSVNLLGQKRLEIDKGDLARPQPSGSTIATSRVTPSTDLDQVLAVLTPDTRSRLNVLLNEAGAAVVGRGTDVSQLIRTLPSTIDRATRVVDGVVSDNRTLAQLVRHSDTLVSDLSSQRVAIGDLIDSAGQAAATAATKRTQLRATLGHAPGMLASLQGFLGKLEQTTVPLGPAARDITAVAPVLLKTVDEIPPFQRAASPTLAKATEVAPSLTTLAAGAAPVLRRTAPTLRRLASFASDLVPVTNTLDRSVDNLIGTVDNWSRAVQYRDGLSHIFRGEAAVTPQTLEGVLNRYLTPKAGTTGARKGAPAPKGTTPGPGSAAPSVPARAPQLPALPGLIPAPIKKALDDTKAKVDDAVGQLVGGLTGRAPKQGGPGPGSASALLDDLLHP